MGEQLELPQGDFFDRIDYDPNTGIFRWKYSWRRAKKGAVAGNVNRYRVIRVDTKNYYAHRLAFMFMLGRWPRGQVDHINGNKLDNRWKNLREVPSEENQRNMKLNKRNKTGCSGVRWQSRRQNWVVYIGAKYLGESKSLLDAASLRKSAEVRCGYHINHGRAA